MIHRYDRLTFVCFHNSSSGCPLRLRVVLSVMVTFWKLNLVWWFSKITTNEEMKRWVKKEKPSWLLCSRLMRFIDFLRQTSITAFSITNEQKLCNGEVIVDRQLYLHANRLNRHLVRKTFAIRTQIKSCWLKRWAEFSGVKFDIWEQGKQYAYEYLAIHMPLRIQVTGE